MIEQERRATQREELVALNVRDLLTAFKMSNRRGVWRFLARIPAERFADEILEFDAIVEKRGLVSAGEFVLERFTGNVATIGAERIPCQGSLIIASNHPGMADAMAVWVAAQREDMKIIAAERDLLQLLPHTRRRLIIIEEKSSHAFREATAHLKSGGALLTFPAGRIEPDAAVRAGALESLACWSPSVAALERKVPGAALLPAFVQGVISPQALRNPILRYIRDEKERSWAAATLQILVPAYRKVQARVAFGTPTRSFEDVLTQMQRLISQSKPQ